MLRPILILGLTALLAGGARLASASPELPPPRYKAVADAYVSSAAPRGNFGRARVLRVGRRPVARAYLRFDLTGLSEAVIEKATLRLGSVGPRGRFSVQLAGNGWKERRITFRNAPRPGRRIAWPIAARRGTLSVDVTKGVTAGKSVTFVLTAPKGALKFRSRESGGAPRLDLNLLASETLIAAGDIAWCGEPYDEATAALVNPIPGTVAVLGDLAYENGTPVEFAACYQPSWGAFKARTRPTPGNHEYQTPGATGYFGYWGSVAGNPAQGWYSYDLGAWHVVSLNSNCSSVGGCHAGSPQETWLRSDLAAHRSSCTLAYWHHPLFSGGQVTNDLRLQPFWQALYDANADLVLSAHAHNYQRFAPQNPAGVADAARGLRQFVVGTGGHPTLHPVAAIANTQVMDNTTWGVLKLTLRSTGYDWQFLRATGGSLTDSGSQSCH